MSDNSNTVESAASDHTDPSIGLDSDAEAAVSGNAVFKPFQRFPIEIRYAIWELAACEPRVVEFEYVKILVELSPENEQEGSYKEEVELGSETLSPAILHTSQESRRVGTKLYERLRSRGVKDIYINWDYDVIFCRGCPDSYMFSYVMNALQRLRDPSWDWFFQIQEKVVRFGLTECQLREFVLEYDDHKNHFKKLKEILVLPQARDEDRDGGDVKVVNTNKRAADVTSWWEMFQMRPGVEVPKQLEKSVKYIHAVRSKDRLLRREGDWTSVVSAEAARKLPRIDPINGLDLRDWGARSWAGFLK
jgi:hypothetical protein